MTAKRKRARNRLPPSIETGSRRVHSKKKRVHRARLNVQASLEEREAREARELAAAKRKLEEGQELDP